MRLFHHTFLILFFAFGILTSNLSAQAGFFTKVSPKGIDPIEAIENIEKISVYTVNEIALRKYLDDAPLEFQNNGVYLPLEIPLPNGKTEVFNMVESPILAPAIAAENPLIKTYTGNGQKNKQYIVRLSLTTSGFNAIILNVDNDAVYFQSYTKERSNYYFNYFAKDARVPDGMSTPQCQVGLDAVDDKSKPTPSLKNMTGDQLRTYRLAIACTGEFGTRHGGTAASAFNVVVGYVNRMNAVYRNDLSVHFNLVSGQNLVYINGATDPYTNSDESIMLGENQTNIDNVIGAANYDVGHVLGTTGGSGGGVATSPCVCDSDKAQGASKEGDVNSFGQVFFDQLLFHETGHQFGMSHSYNSSIPVCTTRNPSTSVEPGSGATIMSYGFTCGTDDYTNSTMVGPILKFHTISYSQAEDWINGTRVINGVSGDCFVGTNTGNSIPVVTMPANLTIPSSTPFSLTGSATDADQDNLTYDWEGIDTGASAPDASTLDDTSEPPFFRSYEADNAPTRTFPILGSILDGTNQAKGDKLPSIGITTNLRMTVRDNNAAGGGVAFGTIAVTVDGNSGPFLVTAPNTGVTWAVNATETVTWNVANTTSAPVSCANVDILLSTDGGQTFPITLANDVPNDGSHDITVPDNSTSLARIKVVCADNIFFDISNVDFTIGEGGGGAAGSCGNPIALTCGEDYNGDTNTGTNNFGSYPNCSNNDQSGKEIIHVITTTAMGDITANLTNISGGDLDLFILSACDNMNCVASSETSGNESATASNQAAGTYYIVVDGFNGASGTYTLNVTSTATCETAAGGCEADAIALTCGQGYNGSTTGGVNNFSGYNCETWDETGKEIIHKITTTATGDIVASLSNIAGGDLDVFILTACDDAMSCLDGGNVTATATNQTAGTYYIVVDGFEGAEGTYTLTVTCPGGGGGNCNTPPPTNGAITDGTYQVTGTMTTGGQVNSPSVVTFKAGTSITLTTGFVAQAGSTFSAILEACQAANDNTVAARTDDIANTSAEPADLQIYPNPATEQAMISYQLDTSTSVSLEIYDINGRKIAHPVNANTQAAGFYQELLATDSYAKGIYFIVLRTNVGIVSKRLAIMK